MRKKSNSFMDKRTLINENVIFGVKLKPFVRNDQNSASHETPLEKEFLQRSHDMLEKKRQSWQDFQEKRTELSQDGKRMELRRELREECKRRGRAGRLAAGELFDDFLVIE